MSVPQMYEDADLIGEDEISEKERLEYDRTIIRIRNVRYWGGGVRLWEEIPFAQVRTAVANRMRGVHDEQVCMALTGWLGVECRQCGWPWGDESSSRGLRLEIEEPFEVQLCRPKGEWWRPMTEDELAQSSLRRDIVESSEMPN